MKQSLRVLMLAWEYPPRIIGGLARVVYFLSRELSQQGVEVYVITADHPGTPAFEIDEYGVHIHRVTSQVTVSGGEWEMPDFRTFIARLNIGMLQHALRLHQERAFDIVHAHDWLVADTAWVLKSIGLPVIATIHATEIGRNHGVLDRPDSIYVGEVEGRLILESTLVIVNSKHMKTELATYFPVSANKLVIVPNGILPDKLACNSDRTALREKYGVGDGPVILFVGRLVQEKGVQFLLQAAPDILKKHPQATFLIAGEGYFQEELVRRSDKLGLTNNVKFLGLVNDAILSELYAIATVAAVPSTYEPFGIVALEAMAAGVPVVTAATGGLMDIFKDSVNGIVTEPGNAEDLGAGISFLLSDSVVAESLKAAARKTVLDRYTWSAIAVRTLEVYRRILSST